VQQSNNYIIIFTVVLTIVLGGLLSAASVFLKPKQKKSIELDTKKQILTAVVDLEGLSGNEILEKYDAEIQSVVVNIDGDIVEEDEQGAPIVAEKVDIAKNYKKAPEERLFPVFKFHEAGNTESVKSYILPVYGTGLWGPIWGYIALETDMNTIKGVVFAHETETPGLGARITEREVQDRFQGKNIFDEEGKLVSVAMLKGENNPNPLLGAHYVDGMSGATITADGLNKMLKDYFGYYEAYIKKVSGDTEKVAAL
jgi:Na+-transporting NADH:ubiquinone oxidoreductase subunit C